MAPERLWTKFDSEANPAADALECRSMTPELSGTGSQRILFVCGGSVFYGAERMALTMMDACVANGCEVECVSSAWTDGLFGEALRAHRVRGTLLYLGWLYVTKPLWTLEMLWRWPESMWGFWRTLRRFQPDVIVCFSYRPVYQLWSLLRGAVILSVHEAPDRKAQRLGLFRWTNRVVARYWTCSEYLRAAVVGAGADEERVITVYNALGPEWATVPHVAEPEGRIRIAVIGRLSEGKGQIVFLRAIAGLPQSVRLGCRFVLYGDGSPEYTAFLRRATEELGIVQDVVFTGFRENMESAYAETDVVVIPATGPEAFGLVAVEAAIHGIPVIASRLGGLAEVVVDGLGGLLVPPGDVQALRDATLMLGTNRELRQKMGAFHREFCHDRFGFDRLRADLASEIAVVTANARARH